MVEAVPVNDSHFSKYDAGGDYLRASDLLIDGEFKSVTLTIEGFHPAGSFRSADGKIIEKPSLSFVGKNKKLIIGATCQEALRLCTGESSGFKTIGCKITVAARYVKAFGDDCLGLRIMPEPGTLMRKGMKKHLGLPAVWHSTLNEKAKDKPTEGANADEAAKTPSINGGEETGGDRND